MERTPQISPGARVLPQNGACDANPSYPWGVTIRVTIRRVSKKDPQGPSVDECQWPPASSQAHPCREESKPEQMSSPPPFGAGNERKHWMAALDRSQLTGRDLLDYRGDAGRAAGREDGRPGRVDAALTLFLTSTGSGIPNHQSKERKPKKGLGGRSRCFAKTAGVEMPRPGSYRKTKFASRTEKEERSPGPAPRGRFQLRYRKLDGRKDRGPGEQLSPNQGL
ncbi:uncharacterized protein LOC114815445 [Ornithorhynchus anatinus]|uniref:uncharacterized protein LOC114815445 n=1 Tax=Ornithorhynchus anatinus TaxID=9258 RepID=UPI0010A870CD|nr:uncharacterized protein LOC114815445 [Ornithorhynchus anatinus]XP_028932288.1 uncharacterized protein LOC114815445 [Ornithorhynchus anatinus]XP_028932289.1 uncharacterized protein LOC114815445 [Ornithorhynchus anatinus]XP_039769604.1 uncharacterized protein LOC114815445 [Ornithorhynchus anatinus]